MSGKRLLFLAVLTAFLPPLLTALEPPTRAEIEQYIRDGTYPARLQNARALGNYLVDPRLIGDFRARLRRIAGGKNGVGSGDAFREQVLPPARRGGLPSHGSVKVFALLIDFVDCPAVNAPALINSRIFGDGNGIGPYESVRNYYRRSSYGALDIGGVTLGWYRPSYPRASIPQTASGRESLIREALTVFDNGGHDFTPYDNDGNGVIDYFIVIWAGRNNGWGNFWWGYQTTFSSGFSLDGKSFTGAKYSWQWESRYWPGPYDQLVVIHETGHALGLPDYYDYDDNVGPRGGVGGLDMMDGTQGDHNSFSKMLLDWLTPRIINYGTSSASLSLAATVADALIAMPEFGLAEPFDEFFMIQNRFRAANDAALPADGLLIWHVDARLNANGTGFLYDNSYSEHKLLRLMEADGQEWIETGMDADAGDYYVPGKTFTPISVPNSNRYDGSASGVSALDIAAPAAATALTVDIHYTLFPPSNATVTRLEGNYIFFREYINRLTWGVDSRNRTTMAKYRIFKKPRDSGDDAFVLLTELAPQTPNTYDHRGLKQDEYYAYRIIAVDRNGAESAAAEVRQ